VGDVINNVPMVKHVSFFESIKLRDKPSPIQKMISMPLVVHGHAIGVAQISRKGETAREAGPDFTPADLRYAQEILDSVAHYLAEARHPEY
jgi:GAF domain-containing protein